MEALLAGLGQHRRSANNLIEKDFAMWKCCLAVILLGFVVSTNSVADEFLLRLETAELRDLPNGEQEPDLKTRESVEILVRAGRAFYNRTTNGLHTISIRGKVEEANPGKSLVQLQFSKTSDTGQSVPLINGQRKTINNVFEAKITAMTLEFGKPVELDGLVTNSKRIRTTLSIDHFDPSNNQDE